MIRIHRSVVTRGLHGLFVRHIGVSGPATIILAGMIFAISANGQTGDDQSVRQQVAPRQARGNYIGHLKCAACHYNQYQTWKGSPHGDAYKILPAKYRKDASCLECHSPAAVPEASDAAVAAHGVSCEACHGPGEQHTKLALTFVEQGITDEGLNRLRTLIDLNGTQLCIGCHVRQAHKPHPEFDRDPNQADASSQSEAASSKAQRSFFRLQPHSRQQGS